MNINRTIAISVMGAWLLPASGGRECAMGSPGQERGGMTWPITYEAGSKMYASGTRFEVAVRKDQIFFESKRTGGFSIPTSSISEVSYDNHSQRRVAEGALLALFFPGPGLLLGISKARRHYVNIRWEESGSPQLAGFRVENAKTGDVRAVSLVSSTHLVMRPASTA